MPELQMDMRRSLAHDAVNPKLQHLTAAQVLATFAPICRTIARRATELHNELAKRIDALENKTERQALQISTNTSLFSAALSDADAGSGAPPHDIAEQLSEL